MKTKNKTAMNTILNRIFMMLTLVTFFISSQSFVQDDTTLEKTSAPSVTDTTVCCEQMAKVSHDSNKGKTTVDSKISFHMQSLEAIDAEVYQNFLNEFSKIDFSFLRKSSEMAEIESIQNFNRASVSYVKFNAANVANGDAESLKNFMAAQPKAIAYNWNSHAILAADAEIVTRFSNEFSPKISLAVLLADNMLESDNALMQQFHLEFGNKKEGFAQN